MIQDRIDFRNLQVFAHFGRKNFDFLRGVNQPQAAQVSQDEHL